MCAFGNVFLSKIGLFGLFHWPHDGGGLKAKWPICWDANQSLRHLQGITLARNNANNKTLDWWLRDSHRLREHPEVLAALLTFKQLLW